MSFSVDSPYLAEIAPRPELGVKAAWGTALEAQFNTLLYQQPKVDVPNTDDLLECVEQEIEVIEGIHEVEDSSDKKYASSESTVFSEEPGRLSNVRTNNEPTFITETPEMVSRPAQGSHSMKTAQEQVATPTAEAATNVTTKDTPTPVETPTQMRPSITSMPLGKWGKYRQLSIVLDSETEEDRIAKKKELLELHKKSKVQPEPYRNRIEQLEQELRRKKGELIQQEIEAQILMKEIEELKSYEANMAKNIEELIADSFSTAQTQLQQLSTVVPYLSSFAGASSAVFDNKVLSRTMSAVTGVPQAEEVQILMDSILMLQEEYQQILSSRTAS
ncbi:hypothetical protein HK102_000863 [Quaeritorhiza haematococci]|nr:hypothetical protein HK102_000863 [Quaeritorhiza haematococci]